MKIYGKIKRIFDTKFVSDAFRIREFVITTSEQYPQHLIIQATQDKCELLDSFKESDDVIVSINIRGREWTSPKGERKYFNTLQAWSIGKNTPTQHQYTPDPLPIEPEPTFDESEEDGLPF